MDNRYAVDGFWFETPKEYEDAKKEYESIRYIKAKTDLTNTTTVVKLYNKLLEKQNLSTPVGLCFLQELRGKILSSGAISENNLRGIEIKKEASKPKRSKSVEAFQEAKDKQYQGQVLLLKDRLRNTRIICAFLAVIVAALFGLTFYFRSNPLYDQEMQLQNKYAAWEQELNEREAALRELEQSLN